MNADALARLKRNIQAATDDTLLALANKGLVRRAVKDLEKGPSPIVEESDDALLIRGDSWTVTMPPDGPSAACDDTAASGVTRQILHATMFLRDHWFDPGESESAKLAASNTTSTEVTPPIVDPPIQQAVDLLTGASNSDLFKWAGKTPLLEAAAAYLTETKIEIKFTPQLTIAFLEDDVRVILMTDHPAKSIIKLLGQFKSTAPKSEHPRWVLQGVLALKAASGKSTNVENDPGSELTDAIREDRLRVARSTTKLLSDVAAAGIAHPSSRVVERFQTASVAADAARFPRLSRLLNSIADDASLQIERDAGADPTRMMQRLVLAHALAEATSRPENADRVDLFGRPRSNYVPVSKLELQGIGAYGWRTASGFEGLTTLFWDEQSHRFLTATSSRGEGQDRAFSIHRAYTEGMGWSGGGIVRDMCRRRIRLTDAKVNPDGRLSSSENCVVTLLDDLPRPTEIDFGIHDVVVWNQLANIARRSQPIGLRLPDSRSAFVVLRPAKWGERWFDELEQSFVWQLYDKTGDTVELRVPWTQVDEDSTAFLESLKVDRDKLSAVFGRLDVIIGRIVVYPFSLFSEGTIQGDTVLCPQFDQDRVRSRNESLLQKLREKFKRQKPIELRMGDDEEDRFDEQVLDAPQLLQNLYFDLDRILISALESGATTLSPAAEETLGVIHKRLEVLALHPLAERISYVLNRGSKPLPNAILSAAYRLQLYRQSLQLSTL